MDEIQNPDSPADGRHYGSLVVKELIEKHKPVLSIAGHVHEGYGKQRISNTLAINAGLHAHVSIEVDQGEVKNLGFHPSLEEYN